MAIYKRNNDSVISNNDVDNLQILTESIEATNEVIIGNNGKKESNVTIFSAKENTRQNDIEVNIVDVVDSNPLLLINGLPTKDPMVDGAIYVDTENDNEIKTSKNHLASFGYSNEMLNTTSTDIMSVDPLNKQNYEDNLDMLVFDDGVTGKMVNFNGKRVLRLSFETTGLSARFKLDRIFPYDNIRINIYFMGTGNYKVVGDNDMFASTIFTLGPTEHYLYRGLDRLSYKMYDDAYVSIQSDSDNLTVYIEEFDVRRVILKKNSRYAKTFTTNKRDYNAEVISGRAYRFDASDSYINCGVINKNNVGTIMFNVKYYGSGWIYSNWDENRVYIAINNNILRIGLANTAWLDTGVILESNQPYHITLVYGDGAWQIYINGILSSTGAYDGTVEYEETDTIIGAKRDLSNQIYSIINDFYVFDTMLSPDEIKYAFIKPEKFIYVNKEYDDINDTYNGVIGSLKLNADTLDKINMCLPMNEGLPNCRDMISYSEGPNIIDSLTYEVSYSGDNNTMTVDGSSIIIHGESFPDDDTDGYVLSIKKDNVEPDKLYLFEIEITNDARKVYINKVIGETNEYFNKFILRNDVHKLHFMDNFIGEDGSVKLVINPNIPNRYEDFDCFIEIKSVREVNGLKSMNNFKLTNTVDKIGYGRQAIYNSIHYNRIDEVTDFNAFKFGKEVRTLSTDLVDNVLMSGGGFVIDMVLESKRIGETGSYFNSTEDGNGFLFTGSKSWSDEGAFYLYNDGNLSYLSYYIKDTNPHHLLYMVTEDKQYLYIDGVLKGEKEHNLKTTGRPLSRGSYTSMNSNMNRFRLIYGEEFKRFNLEGCIRNGLIARNLIDDTVYVEKDNGNPDIVVIEDFDFGVIGEVNTDITEYDFGLM